MSLERPLVVYDGDCAFCLRWIERFRLRTGDAVDYAPYQEAAGRFPDVPEDAFRAAVHLFEPDGKVHRGAGAIFRALSHGPGRAWPAMLYAGSPGFARASEAVYGWVAAHRVAASRLTTLFMGRDVRPATFLLTRWIFLRLLGICALGAFVSLAGQIVGLAGERGIAPAPPLFGVHFTDGMLSGMAWGGAIASALVVANLATGWALLAAVLLYFALAAAGGPFMQYQWDALLLEALVAAMLWTPWRLRPSLDEARPPRRAALWLARFLVFKLFFLSGAVKRMSGDVSWRDLTALRFHYWTQPLPSWTSWYAANLPPWVHTSSAAGMFFIELWLPILVFVPRRGRWLAFLGFVLLQLVIAATGNYGFFNWLAIALAFVLLDDAQLLAALPARLATKVARVRTAVPPRGFSIAAVLAGVLLAVSVERTWYAVRGGDEEPAALAAIARPLAEIGLVHTYGLFAVMTTSRHEIIVEGSQDGVSWRPYPFRYKPGDPRAAPRFAPMHLPRLDWQMWFFALSEDCENEPAYVAFASRLMEGSPDVLGLLANDPFEGKPPRYLRSRLADYRFTTRAERAATGAYWVTEPLGDYCFVLARR